MSQPRISPPSQFTATSTSDEVLQGIDLNGTVAVVTGAASGIGSETARALASKGAHVVLCGRTDASLIAAEKGITATLPSASLSRIAFDLSDHASIRRGAAAILEQYPKIDILINNAGIMACPLTRTTEGHELQFATNHTGHFLLTGLLVPALVAAGSSRVVTLSSAAHKYSPVVFADIDYRQRPYEKWEAYGQSKTANALFAVELGRRLGGRGVHSFAVHPGVIVTNLSRHLTQEDFRQLMEESATNGIGFTYKSIPQGAATSVWAATAAELADRNGLYLEDCAIAREVSPDNTESGYFAYARDGELAKQLWAVSEAMVGEKFPS